MRKLLIVVIGSLKKFYISFCVCVCVFFFSFFLFLFLIKCKICYKYTTDILQIYQYKINYKFIRSQKVNFPKKVKITLIFFARHFLIPRKSMCRCKGDLQCHITCYSGLEKVPSSLFVRSC